MNEFCHDAFRALVVIARPASSATSSFGASKIDSLIPAAQSAALFQWIADEQRLPLGVHAGYRSLGTQQPKSVSGLRG
jgi:hypothetical protein